MQLRIFPFYFYFLEQSDDVYILAEASSYLFFINMSSVRTDYFKFLVIFHHVNVTKYKVIHSSLSMTDNSLYRNMISCTGG